jgi:hypothetical protein
MAAPAAPSLAVPAYFASGREWRRLAARGGGASIAVLNPGNGPGARLVTAYVAAVRRAQAHGVRVLGYIHTSYAAQSASVVLAEAERYLAWYGVDGIFFDEAASDCAGLPYYAGLNRALKACEPALLVALNPGTRPDACYMDAAEIVVTFEGDLETYLREPAPPDWLRRYPAARFWQIVYGVPDAEAMARVLALAGARHAGQIYITDGTLPNPYGRLPAYWSRELRAVAAPAAVRPAGLLP